MRRTSLPLPLRPSLQVWHKFRQRWSSRRPSIPLPLPLDYIHEENSSSNDTNSNSADTIAEEESIKDQNITSLEGVLEDVYYTSADVYYTSDDVYCTSDDVYYTTLLGDDETVYDLMYVTGQGTILPAQNYQQQQPHGNKLSSAGLLPDHTPASGKSSTNV